MATRKIEIDGEELLAVMKFVDAHGDALERLSSELPDALGRAGESFGGAAAATLEASTLLTNRDGTDAVDVTTYTASALDECGQRLDAISRVLTRAEKRASGSDARDLATSNDQITAIAEALGEAAAGLRELGVALGITGERLGEAGGEMQRGAELLSQVREGRAPRASRPKRTRTPPARRTKTERPTIERPSSARGTKPATKRSTAKKPTTKRSTAKKPTTKRSTAKKPTTKRSTAKKPSSPAGMQPTGRSARSSSNRGGSILGG